MGNRWVLFFYIIVTSYIYGSNACTINGLPNWLLPESVRISDTHRGIIYNRSTSGIDGINSITPREGLNGGPYVSVTLVSTELVILTNDDYPNFEEVETANSIGISINFRCNDGTSRILVFNIDITDTNNHDPVFIPSNSYEYTIAPPVPANFSITNCISDLVVRDIDLTTERIDFTLEGSSLFEIVYDRSSTVPKEFKAIVRTTTFIRSLPEPIILTITATDVDTTGDPPRIANATVRILADSQFALPDEPIFSQPYYMADYTAEHDVILQDSIYLRQGYDSQVNFTLEGQFSEHFELKSNGNQVTLNVSTELDLETIENDELYLIVKAERELTSGSDAVIVLRLPEARELGFEKPSYRGYLEERNVLTLETIILSVGYHSGVNFNLTGQYAELFSLSNNRSRVTIEIKEQESDDIVKNNNFLVLTLSASGMNAISASTTIFLEIIKLDYVTPVFSQNIYNGIYLSDTNVSFQNISLLQGYDESVTFNITGEYARFFSLETTTTDIRLSLNSSIPDDMIFNEKVLLFNIVAEKPRTVGANTAVAVKFPKELTEPTILKFTKNTYHGILEDGELNIEDVILESGYTPQINFTLNEEMRQYFYLSNIDNIITIRLSSTVSAEELVENKFVTLEIEAAREKAVSVTTTVIIDILKINIIVPIFEKPLYRGFYTIDGRLNFTEEITLQMGYDISVTFSLEGVSSQWFSLTQNENSVTLIHNNTNPIPEDILDTYDHIFFSIVANKPETISGRAAIHIDLPKDIKSPIVLKFEHYQYIGRIENDSLQLEGIRLLDVTIPSVELNITGDYASYFRLKEESNMIIIEMLDIPEDVIRNNELIVLNMEATQPNSIKGHTTIILYIVKNQEPQIVSPIFEQAYYFGEYSAREGLILFDTIKLAQGFDETISFSLDGENSQWFELVKREENNFTLSVNSENLHEVTNNSLLIFTVFAHKTYSDSARAAIVISLKAPDSVDFTKGFYVGYLENGTISLEAIALKQNYTNDVNLTLRGGGHSIINNDGVISLQVKNEIPVEIIESNMVFVFALEAHKQNTRAETTIILEIKKDIYKTSILEFEKVYYVGSYSQNDGLIFENEIQFMGEYDETVRFTLDGDDSVWFSINTTAGSVTLIQSKPINDSIISNFNNFIFTIKAEKENTIAESTIIIEIIPAGGAIVLTFEQTSYIGIVNSSAVLLDQMILSNGYSKDVTFSLHGGLATYFQVIQHESTITLAINTTIPEDILASNEIIVLDLKASATNASSAIAVIVLDVKTNELILQELDFNRTYYIGNYNEEMGLNFTQTITLANGYDNNTKFVLEGEYTDWFHLEQNNNLAILVLTHSIPPAILIDNQVLILEVVAEASGGATARTVVVISHDYDANTEEAFDKVLYNGSIDNGQVSHEAIVLFGDSENNVQITGEYESSFEITNLNGTVTVRLASPASQLPADLKYVALTLRAGRANAVLLLDVITSGDTDIPSVIFSKLSYFVWVDVNQTGVVGRVEATANNNEAILYSIQGDDDSLQGRISVNSDGEVILSTTLDSGVHSFIVTATTQTSRINATATLLLRVEALTNCNSDIGLPPLLILEVLEEEPHRNLVVFNETKYGNCRFNLSNIWPPDQSWLYVDDEGLHARAIDREDESIAFMTLSQIQVELMLQCDSDEVWATKCSLNTERLELRSDNYGSNKWILADTIVYDARRSTVNVIVNDINDNTPIFIGKENEPIYVGFPIPELENMILPRALVEVKATDADIDENAALIYSSIEDNLAVAPQTGFVHVRDNTLLENNARFTMYATDQNGRGLNGTLDIVVKLLDRNQIAVVTIRNAFLNDEDSVLRNLSHAIGYQVKILKTVVISEVNEYSSRKKRDVASTPGASLQLYVYGLYDSEPVDVVQLTNDINNSNTVIVNIARVLSLEDHLEGIEICPVPGRDIGLLVATIVLAVLLLLVIIAIGLWFILIKKNWRNLKWTMDQDYDQLNDTNSLASQNNTVESIPKVENTPKPRLNIEELKKSERRLQEMLEAPIKPIESEQNVEDKNNESPTETIVDIIAPVPQLPIVIQSIDKLKDNNDESDDDDEFGEKKQNRRKSVVTFNENVEKIIHLEDNFSESPEPNSEVYKF